MSVGLPVYNGERFLARAIDSYLAQDYGDFELVISDNASTDATEEICRGYARRDPRVRYHRNPANLGARANFDRVFRLSSGEYFKWAAHDDWCAPEFLGRCVAVLDEEPETVLCFTAQAVTDGDGTVLEVTREDLDRAASPDLRERFHTVMWSLSDCTAPIFGLMRSTALARVGALPNVPEPDRVVIIQLALLGRIRQLAEPLFFHYGPPGHPSRDQWTWLDPANAGRIKAATPRITARTVAAVWRADASLGERLLLAGDAVAALGVMRTRGKARILARRWARRRGREAAARDGGGR